MREIVVGDRKVGNGQPALVIAEVGVNHNGSVERGIELIESAAKAGADVVKFQTYKAGQIVTKKAPVENNTKKTKTTKTSTKKEKKVK